MKLQGILLALTAWTTAAAIGIPTAVPDLSQVAIAGLTYGGSGCPPDTLGLILSNDKSAMIVFFDGFIVMIGPGIPIIENRKNCQLRVDLQHPSGFQYTPVAGTFSTNGYLGEGVTATFRSTYFFSGQAGSSVPANCSVSGPIRSDTIRCESSEPPPAPVWSPCGVQNSSFTMSTQLRLMGSKVGASGLLESGGSWGTSFQYPFSVLWRECEDL